jgi:tRNA pseudouridine32 synthase / 23S rRNA pseudouridine746 synthase
MIKNQLIFDFEIDITNISIPKELNNPFGSDIPEVARIAADEFQKYITSESQKWDYNFKVRQGKMFGILVIQKEDNSYGYLGTISGKISRHSTCPRFVSSVFDDSTDDYFINRDMTELTLICNKINKCDNPEELIQLKEHRQQHSFGIQQRIFENSYFRNTSGQEKNIIEIFENSLHGNPPSAAGECAAPKLLQYAMKNQLRPIAVAEFWWGNPIKTKERKHQSFYPACKNKCRPILQYMLDDENLYHKANPKP